MEIIRQTHIISGIIIALTGLLQILLPKGGKFHRVIGTVYFLAWPAVVVTGGLLGSFIITMLGGMGFYMAYTGYRFGRLKNTGLHMADKGVIVLSLMVAVGLSGFGIYLLLKNGITFGIVCLFFGGIFSSVGIKDFNGYIRQKKNRRLSGHPLEWFFEHFGRMYISYIAAMTAFTVIQNPFPVVIFNWILPTFIGTVMIVLTTRYYGKKYKIKQPDNVE